MAITPIKLYNTLSRIKEDFQPTQPGQVNLYSCGPTVYNFAHIGNFRSYIFADLLVRMFTQNGTKPNWIMNITDIDDKTIKGAILKFGPTATVEDLKTYTGKYLLDFLADLKSFSIFTTDSQIVQYHLKKQIDFSKKINFIRVTDIIPQIQEFIVTLINKGFAYQAEDGSTYFSIEKYQEKFGDYGRLVGDAFVEGKKIGARVKVDEYDKNDLSDFALWKIHTTEDANIYWDHPILGKGRPGWSIECSVINNVAFGNNTIDIHTGGIDLMFPHHTNEIAQSKAFTGNEFVKYWMHNGFLNVDDEKMSKSKGGFYTLADLANHKIRPLTYRYWLLSANYKKPINFTWEALEGAQNAYDRLIGLLIEIQNKNGSDGNISSSYQQKFSEFINDDLDTPQALALIWDLLRDETILPVDKLVTILDFDRFLGLDLFTAITKTIDETPKEVIKLANLREQARKDKNYSQSDELRQEITQLGYTVDDTEDGPKIRKS